MIMYVRKFTDACMNNLRSNMNLFKLFIHHYVNTSAYRNFYIRIEYLSLCKFYHLMIMYVLMYVEIKPDPIFYICIFMIYLQALLF